jgi:hypothetical protein
MSVLHAAPTRHVWKFFRTGGLEQVALETAEDLLALGELDQKLWVALSCPVKGTEIDEATLRLIDADGDGHIHVGEVVAAVQWAAAHLKRPGDLLTGGDALPLDAINDLVPEGKSVLHSARLVLRNLGKSDATSITTADMSDTTKILAAKAPNGDGVITLRATTDAGVQALIKDIIASVGGVPAGQGGEGEGVNAGKIEEFFKAVESYVGWLDAAAKYNIPALGDGTSAAFLAVTAVRPKIDDYFARCRLAEFDPRAIAALNRQESEYLGLAAKDLSISTEEIAGFPLARIEACRPLPLTEKLNPAWAGPMATFRSKVVVPFFAGEKTTLTAEDWAKLTAAFAPYETWLGNKPPSPVEKLGGQRARELLHGAARQQLDALVAEDKALGPQYQAISSVARLAHYYRDLRALLHNFVNFADFYSPERWAVFQAGQLYLDGRACELCVWVHDVALHSTFAAKSMAFVAYLDCKRTGGETAKIAACFTQGDSDFLFVGRNGLFYDRRGRDWDATITKVVEAPISIRQAFWSPYKKVASFVEDQFTKFAAAKEKSATTTLAGTVTALPAAPHPPAAGAPAATAATARPGAAPFDIAKFAGIFAAIGLAIGAIGGALSSVAIGFLHLKAWQMPLAVIGALMIISGPSMLLAALKLRQRNLGPLLEPNGWAINGRVHINIPFGSALTERALLPANARLSKEDPYEDKEAARHRRLWKTVFILLVLALIVRGALHEWPFEKDTAPPPTGATAATPAPAAAPAAKK